MAKRFLVALLLAGAVEGAFASQVGKDALIGEARRTVRRVSAGEPTRPDDPNATAWSTPASPPRPALANFGLGLGVTGAGVSGLTAILSLMAKNAAEHACANRCPPPSWSAPDPSQATLGKISAASLAIGAAGAGLTLGSLALQHKRKKTESPTSPSIGFKVMPGGAGLAVKF
jgi:hypothetical protein